MSRNAEASADRPVTLITGTSRGIGAALALHFSRAGHRVIGCSRTTPEQQLDDYTHVAMDIRDEHAVGELFRTIRTQFGRLDHLINNAGVASMNHALTTPVDTVRAILDTNVTATFLFSREAAKLMRKRQYGRIVNLSSVAVPLAIEGEAAYAASKAAIEMLTRVLAREFGDMGITVNAVGPTPIDTALIKGVPKDRLRSLEQRQAIPLPAEMEDVTCVVEFFVSPTSRMVTGQVIYLGGA